MKVKNNQAEIYYNNLIAISSKVTGKFAYIISRNIRKLNTELQEYLDVKNNCIQKYGELGKDGLYSLKTDSKNYADYVNDMKQYDDIEIDIEIMKVLPEDLYSSNLSAAEMLLIDFMIKEE